MFQNKIGNQFKGWLKPLGLKWLGFRHRSRKNQREKSGFTLIELIVSSLLISVVILVAWSGLISLTNMSAVAEARGTRKAEVNQALDFVTEELRSARYVNADGIHEVGISVMDGGDAMTISDLLTDKGFDFNRLGNYGDLALYLEVPAKDTPPLTCPADGPNANSAPPSPNDYDQVIYDVRPSPNDWLGPKVLMRYGRLRTVDGAFNPCDMPVAGDPIADALSDDTTDVPSCPGILTGGAGFYACKADEQTQVFFQNTLVETSVKQVSSAVTPRLQPIQPSPVATTGCENEANLHTLNRQTKAKMKFFNQSTNEVKIFWLNEEGDRQFFETIEPNETEKSGTTYLTQPWVVTDMSENCLAVFMPEDSDGLATIK